MSKMHDLDEGQGKNDFVRSLYFSKAKLVEKISRVARLDEKTDSSLGFVELYNPLVSMKVHLTSAMSYVASNFKAPDRLGFSASGVYVTGHSFSLRHSVVENKVFLEVYPVFEDGTFQRGVIERDTGELSVVQRFDLPIFSSEMDFSDEMILEQHDERSGYETVYKYLILLTNALIPASVRYQSRINSVPEAIKLLGVSKDKEELLYSCLLLSIYDRNTRVIEYQGENPDESFEEFKNSVVDIHKSLKEMNPITALISAYREIFKSEGLPENYRNLIWDAFEVSKPINIPENNELFMPPLEIYWNCRELELYGKYFQRVF